MDHSNFLTQIIRNLPSDYPDWALKRAASGAFLPSGCEEQAAWNNAVAAACQDRIESVEEPWAKFLAVDGLIRHLNCQKTRRRNFPPEVRRAYALLEQAEVSLAHSGAHIPQQLKPRIFGSAARAQEAIAHCEEFSLRRAAGSSAWMLHFQGQPIQRAPYALLSAFSAKSIKFRAEAVGDSAFRAFVCSRGGLAFGWDLRRTSENALECVFALQNPDEFEFFSSFRIAGAFFRQCSANPDSLTEVFFEPCLLKDLAFPREQVRIYVKKEALLTPIEFFLKLEDPLRVSHCDFSLELSPGMWLVSRASGREFILED